MYDSSTKNTSCSPVHVYCVLVRVRLLKLVHEGLSVALCEQAMSGVGEVAGRGKLHGVSIEFSERVQEFSYSYTCRGHCRWEQNQDRISMGAGPLLVARSAYQMQEERLLYPPSTSIPLLVARSACQMQEERLLYPPSTSITTSTVLIPVLCTRTSLCQVSRLALLTKRDTLSCLHQLVRDADDERVCCKALRQDFLRTGHEVKDVGSELRLAGMIARIQGRRQEMLAVPRLLEKMKSTKPRLEMRIERIKTKEGDSGDDRKRERCRDAGGAGRVRYMRVAVHTVDPIRVILRRTKHREDTERYFDRKP